MFQNKKILVTGCTGFTGSWLLIYLHLLKANIFGYSTKAPFKNSIFEKCNLKKKITFCQNRIENFNNLNKFYQKCNPDIIFHLAANPIVTDCYKNPRDAYLCNTLGTLNLLECVRISKLKKKISINIISTDKVYKNDDKIKKFSENDMIGGDEPYSSSKTCAENICKAYYNSYFKNKNVSMNIFRSGNIIGGGDWSKYRIVPDIMRSIFSNQKLKIKNPDHIRPWQHVFDVIYAYTETSKKMMVSKPQFQIWNVGPKEKKTYNVLDILKIIENKLNKKIKARVGKKNSFEKKNLELNCNKILKEIKHKNLYNTKDSINNTVDWYLYFKKNKKILNYSLAQLKKFLKK
jgi:CDP-glucose 4,6-dehydratase